MKLIIAGSRDCQDRDLVFKTLDSLNIEITEIVSGCAEGPDTFGEEWAIRNRVPVKRFPPDFKRWGKSAGPRRNIQMLEYADYLIAFWDGKSKGTKHTIDNAEKYNVKSVTVYV
jgi:hypothetical protein